MPLRFSTLYRKTKPPVEISLILGEVGIIPLLLLASCVNIRSRKPARTVKIAVDIQVPSVKVHNHSCICLWDMDITHMLSHARGILTFHQRVVMGLLPNSVFVTFCPK